MAESSTSVGNIEAADVGVIVGYFVIVMGFGIWSSLKNRGSVGGYFLAGRSMNFVLIGASLFASNIGSGHFIGLAGSGASSGIGIAVFELNAIFILLILGWIFVPVYIASGVYTMPEYLRKRFGGQRIRIYLAVLALILSIFTKVAADLYAGAIFINQALGWNIYAAIVLLLAIAALFTIAGGLTAVIWTDFIQTVIMIIGAVFLMIVSFVEVGGYENTTYQFRRAIPNTTQDQLELGFDNVTCGRPPDNYLVLFRSAQDANYPWPGVVFGLTISSVWYWCSDQVIVQRALASKNLTHAKAGTVLAGWLKMLPMWLLVVPGMISRILFPDEVACADPDTCEEICGSRTGCTNIAYPLLVIRLMPIGARGLMLAVMMSALMSSLTSIFNSSSTIFAIDIWTRFRKEATEMELMVVGRVFVLAMVGIGIAWIPIVQNFAELFHYIQSVTSYLAPPICAVYVLAVLWKRTNEKGAFFSLMIGLAVGLVRFIWESVYGQSACGEESSVPAIISDVHYLHFGMMLFGIVFISCMVISAFTAEIPDIHLQRLLFWNRFSKEPRVDIDAQEEAMAQQREDEARERRERRAHHHDNPAYSGSQGDIPDATNVDIKDDDEDDIPCYRTAFNWICGIEKQPDLTDEQLHQMDEMAKKSISLKEDPFWNKVCNVSAVLLMTAGVFVWAFFN